MRGCEGIVALVLYFVQFHPFGRCCRAAQYRPCKWTSLLPAREGSCGGFCSGRSVQLLSISAEGASCWKNCFWPFSSLVSSYVAALRALLFYWEDESSCYVDGSSIPKCWSCRVLFAGGLVGLDLSLTWRWVRWLLVRFVSSWFSSARLGVGAAWLANYKEVVSINLF